MNVQSISFVYLTDLFEGYNDLLHEFIGEELLAHHPYGEAAYYFIKQGELMELLEDFVFDHPKWQQEAEEIQKRMEELRPHVLIDLAVKA